MRAGLAPPAPCRRRRRRTASCPFVGERKRIENSERGNRDRSASGRAPRWALPHRFDRNSTSASNMNSNRSGTAWRRRGECTRDASAVGSLRKRGSPPAARQIPVASSLRDRLCRARRIHRRVIMSAGTVANGVRHSLMAREHCGGCAACPDGDRTGTCQHTLLKAAGRELASRSADLPRRFAPIGHCASNGTNLPPGPYLVI